MGGGGGVRETDKRNKLKTPVGGTYPSDDSGDNTHQSSRVIERDQCTSLSNITYLRANTCRTHACLQSRV